MKSAFIFNISLVCLLLLLVEGRRDEVCLMGHMTEMQSWVDEKGVLLVGGFDTAMDLSATPTPVQDIQNVMGRAGRKAPLNYLSMARCRLDRIPMIFDLADDKGNSLSEALMYVTFYGNSFVDISPSGDVYGVSMNATDVRETSVLNGLRGLNIGSLWSAALTLARLPKLLELDLRACSIQVLSGRIFAGMPQLQALYLGENEIVVIDSQAFHGLNNLYHLDLSKNGVDGDGLNTRSVITDDFHFEGLSNLTSLDLSFTKLYVPIANIISKLGPRMRRLSICYTGTSHLPDYIFSHTSIEILDVTGNNGIFSRSNVLKGLEKHLKVIYAKDIGLTNLNIFEGFANLEVLDVSKNEIGDVSAKVTESLTSLLILNLDLNRLVIWSESIYSKMPNLQLLSLMDNNINFITEHMIFDMGNVSYLAMSGNFIVCNCVTRDLYDLVVYNEENRHYDLLSSRGNYSQSRFMHHKAFEDFNSKIAHRDKAIRFNDDPLELNEELKANFILFDFHHLKYTCLQLSERVQLEFFNVSSCSSKSRDIDFDTIMHDNWNRLYILFMVPILFVFIIIGYVLRRKFRYCFITMRNSAMLTFINNNEIDDDTIFHYDVFVSYCHEDRGWVLDHLIPHLEADCSISACLHERDFQVGHSILENIVSCMDRSRSIMLIISQRFLLSKWCQFEMHLAQHRLLETRREDLTLVLLEDIPKKIRPNTLHYLMLTKTYIVWPSDEHDRDLFWKRLKKTFLTLKLRSTTEEKVSVA